MQRKLILLGVDGASWSILAPLISKGEIPNFRELVSKGVVGTLQSTIPPHSPPSWTSMFTGVNPGKHGIVDFLLREKGGVVSCFSRYRMCKSVWKILSECGRRVVVINEPVTFPPEEVNGIMTTGLMTPPGSPDWIYPKELKNEINMIAGGYESDIPKDFISMLQNDRKNAAESIENLALKVFRVSKYAASKFDWDVLAVIFTSTDRLQHYWWHDGPEISKHYKLLDMMLGEYMKYADELGADIVIVSDHGFGPVTRFFRLDKWLQESGLAIYKETIASKAMSEVGLNKDKIANLWRSWRVWFSLLPDFMQNALRKLVPEGRPVPDVKRSGAFAIGSGVFVNSDQKEYVAKQLRELTDKLTGVPIFEEVVDRNDALKGPYAYRAPDLFLQPSPGYFVFPKDKFMGLPIEEGSEMILTASHRPDGIFLHYRPNNSPPQVASGSVRPWDIAALILNVLGIPLPDYFDGKPPAYLSHW